VIVTAAAVGDVMKTYKYKSKHYGFQVSIPDDWGSSRMLDLAVRLSGANEYLQDPSGKVSDERTLLGPNRKYLHILITSLLEHEPVPTINETEEYFDGLTYRQNLNVIATGTINVANKEHFWATYYRMTLMGPSQIQFFKKYCLYLNRVEYLITAGLYFASSGEELPTDQMIEDNERIYDEIVLSFKLLNA
jgi:hypothetical protein